MSKNESSSSNEWAKIATTIIVTIGTIVVAYFTYRGIVAPKELEISATQLAESLKATQTAEAKLTSSGLTPSHTVLVNTPDISPSEILSTSTPTFLPISTSTLLLEKDFSTNCINATDWTPYTAVNFYPQVDNCWDLTKSGIAAQNGNLSFVVHNDSPQSGSLYMPIPKEGTVKFTVKIDTFISGETNGNLAFGVGTVTGWLTKGDFLFFRTTNSGYYIVYGNSVIEAGKRTIDSYQLGSDVLVAFQFNNLAFDIYVNNSKIVSDIPLSESESQIFWIGYRLPVKSKLVASLSDFAIEK